MPPAPARPSDTPRKFRGLLQEERVGKRRAQLIEAGLQTFGTRGFHSVSVRDICVEAKLTERYFYESFVNREALFLAVYGIGIDRVRANISAALVGAKPQEIARAGLRAYLETLREEPRLARILLVESLRIGLEVSSQSLLATTSFAEMLSAIIVELYPDLRARKLDVQWISLGLVGATVFIAMRWAMREFDEPLETVLDHCVAFYESLASQASAPGSARKPPRRRVTRR